MEQKYYKVSQVAQIFGMDAKTVRNHCHSKDQRFAVQPVKGGNILIDIKKFETYLGLRRPEARRAI